MSAINFDRRTCLAVAGTFPPNSSLFLFGSTPDHPIFSLDTCREVCGSSTGWFVDSLPRFNTWLVPLLVLLANLQYPTVRGPKRIRSCVAAGAHMLADPIYFTFSLLSQVEGWIRCLTRAKELRPRGPGVSDQTYDNEIKSVVVLLAAFERIVEPCNDDERGNELFHTLERTLVVSAQSRLSSSNFEARVAREIILSRANNVPAAGLSVAFYAWQVAGAFVPYIAGNPTPSGGRIAYALLLSWILFTVLLTNLVGEFTSSTILSLKLQQFLEQRHPKFSARRLETLVLTSSRSIFSRKNHFRFRPHKKGRSPYMLMLFSVLPALVAITFSIAVTTIPPTYLSIRHSLILSISMAYLISPFVTAWIRSRWGPDILLIKDVTISILILFFLILASCGLFNNCEGWNPVYPNLGVALNPESDFSKNQEILFPIFVSLCLGLQVGLWVMILCICARGFGVMKDSKDHKWRNDQLEALVLEGLNDEVPIIESEKGRDVLRRKLDSIVAEEAIELTQRNGQSIMH
ncbi:hypothetical protein K402DRAFT_202344 [Aulographum hederae CBS 113979]|uniref:Uncharacterized protein n=1 Tax=Aulographum hederae CBS 113979 TaxID=1176131 RepID=A0A6G1HC21_9PEZI|nr:hypothetical protein K402DRAFT_202344 [Aulographum hederae CBS 113979]